MKKQMKTKALVLSLAMAAMLALPTMASAQESRSNFGGLFGTKPTAKTANEEQGMLGGNRSEGLSNQTFGEDVGGGPQTPTELVPLGGGLLIMMIAGAGYALLKKKED